jgi:hypothetical protein
MLRWKERPEATAREVLTELVEREVLAGAAREKGFLERPEIEFARKQGMVAALLRERVEEMVVIDESKAEGFPFRVQQQRRVPRGIRASHIVILVSDDDEDESEQESLWEAAEEAIAVARGMLAEEVDDDALRRVAAELNADYLREGLEAVVNEHMLFPRVGERFQPDQLPQGWTQVVGTFAQAAETVAGEDKIGTLSEPVRTEFGWHLIRVEDVMEERLVEPEALEQFVQDQLRLDAQITQLGKELKEWGEDVEIELHPDRLERSIGSESF